MKKICIVGMGNMGKAMWEILSKKGFELIGCGKGDDINEKMARAEIVIVAVKPQVFGEVAESVKIDLSGKLIISIMAGIGIEKMAAALKTKKIVRTLPNLALKVGQSLTVWKANEGVSVEEKAIAKEILMSFGQEMEVDEEEKISVIGAVSGCGPGFFAYFGEQMSKFLLKRGIPAEKADEVAKQTLIGTGEVVRENNWNLMELRQKVSSKGGLTEAGVKVMEENKIEEIFDEVGEAALKREKELNK